MNLKNTLLNIHSKITDQRKFLSAMYIRGHGLEFGACTRPLPLLFAKAEYADSIPTEQLENHVTTNDFASNWNVGRNFVNVDLVLNAQESSKLPQSKYDFIVANHILEHLENPLSAVEGMVHALKSEGKLFFALPVKRYFFDANRKVTSIEHIIQDEKDGGLNSRPEHIEEWVRLVEKEYIYDPDYPGAIHWHVWDYGGICEFYGYIADRFNLRVINISKNFGEMIGIFEKL